MMSKCLRCRYWLQIGLKESSQAKESNPTTSLKNGLACEMLARMVNRMWRNMTLALERKGGLR